MIRKACREDAPTLAALALKLWPHHTLADLTDEFSGFLKEDSCALFLAWDADTAVGFAQCQLRRDYVEGTETSPVGYLEGIFVRPGYRRQGLARQLLSACENWAKEMGCREFASDCELTNTQSQTFHRKAGFTEANRIVCFTKKL